MSEAQHSIEHYLEAAREMAAKIDTHADRIDSERKLPPEITDEMKAKGLFRLLLPRTLGGAELDHPDFLKIVEVFAEVNGSAGWCVNQNNVFSTNSTRMHKQTAKELYSDQQMVVTNGPPMPQSKAVPVDGGYQLSGRWNFSSGSPHAKWLAALTPVRRDDEPAPSLADRSSSRVMLLPKEKARMVDNWDVVGLRGTGSMGFEIEDLFVPEEHTYNPEAKPNEAGPLYCVPTTLWFAPGFATVALGASRAALNAVIELAKTKVQGFDDQMLRDLSTTQRTIGEVEATWGSAKAFLREATTALWNTACENRSPTREERIRVRLASTYAIRQAGEVVDVVYTLGGSDSIFATNPIQRRFRDVHTIMQQIQGRQTHYETTGQYFLGLDPGGIF